MSQIADLYCFVRLQLLMLMVTVNALLKTSESRTLSAFVGDNVTFSCHHGKASDIRWRYFKNGSRESTQLNNNDGIRSDYANRTSLSVSSPHSNLTVHNVHVTDEGKYECFELFPKVSSIMSFDLRIARTDNTPATIEEIPRSTASKIFTQTMYTISSWRRNGFDGTTEESYHITQQQTFQPVSPINSDSNVLVIVATMSMTVLLCVMIVIGVCAIVKQHRSPNQSTLDETLRQLEAVADHYQRSVSRSYQMSASASQNSVFGTGSGQVGHRYAIGLDERSQHSLPYPESAGRGYAGISSVSQPSAGHLPLRSLSTGLSQSNGSLTPVVAGPSNVSVYAELASSERVSSSGGGEEQRQSRQQNHNFNAVYADIDHRINGLHVALH